MESTFIFHPLFISHIISCHHIFPRRSYILGHPSFRPSTFVRRSFRISLHRFLRCSMASNPSYFIKRCSEGKKIRLARSERRVLRQNGLRFSQSFVQPTRNSHHVVVVLGAFVHYVRTSLSRNQCGKHQNFLFLRSHVVNLSSRDAALSDSNLVVI